MRYLVVGLLILVLVVPLLGAGCDSQIVPGPTMVDGNITVTEGPTIELTPTPPVASFEGDLTIEVSPTYVASFDGNLTIEVSPDGNITIIEGPTIPVDGNMTIIWLPWPVPGNVTTYTIEVGPPIIVGNVTQVIIAPPLEPMPSPIPDIDCGECIQVGPDTWICAICSEP